MRITARGTSGLLTVLRRVGALLLVLAASLVQASPAGAASGWQSVPAPAPQGFSAYVPFDGSSAVARTSVPTGTVCLPCTYDHTLWTRQAGTWRTLPLPVGGGADVLAGTATDDVWAFGRGERGQLGAHHWDGSAWSDRTVPDMEVLAARAVSRDDVWAVGRHREDGAEIPAAVAHWDGAAWAVTRLRVPGHWTTLKAVHVASADDVWAVGSSTERTLDGVSRPYAAHWDGSSWREVQLPAVSALSGSANAVVTRGSEVWIGGVDRDAVADAGTGAVKAFALRWDGAAWKLTFVPVAAWTGNDGKDGLSLNALAYHDGTLWAGLTADPAKDQALARWNGSGWEAAPGPGTSPVSDVSALYTTADGTLWAQGLNAPRRQLAGYAASLAPGAVR